MNKIKKIRNIIISSFVLFFLTDNSIKLFKGYKYANYIYNKHLNSNSHHELIVAHRGFSGLYIDNSLDSINAALASPCVDMIEIDVRITQNGKIVLHHDQFLNLEDTSIKIEDLTLEDYNEETEHFTINSYKYYNPLEVSLDDQLFLYKRFLNKKVDLSELVFLSTIINNYSFDKPLIIDVKTNHEDINFMDELNRILNSYKDKIFIQSDYFDFLNKMIELYPDYKYLYIVNSRYDLKRKNDNFIGYTVKYSLLDKMNIENDKMYLVYTINSSLKYNNLINNKKYRDNMYIITDNPDYICSLSDNKVLRK